MSRHQAVRYDVEHEGEVFCDSTQEEEVVLPLIEDRLPIGSAVVDVVMLTSAQFSITSQHGNHQMETSEVSKTSEV